MKLLITGSNGRLGRSVVRRGRIAGHAIAALDHAGLDLARRNAAEVIAQRLDALAPDVVINAAAYTDVDRAETERDRAFAVNADGAGALARACSARSIGLLHVSTDYVFDGSAHSPYGEDAAVAPLSAYGASKAEGEARVHAAGGTVIRTSWLFAAGGRGFVQTVIRRASELPVLRIVADQHGCPTSADDLADALLALAAMRTRAATYHACNAEPTTWHGFAQAIVEEARRFRALACDRVEPIATTEYPTPARRPAYSVLGTSRLQALGIALPQWRASLRQIIVEELGASHA